MMKITRGNTVRFDINGGQFIGKVTYADDRKVRVAGYSTVNYRMNVAETTPGRLTRGSLRGEFKDAVDLYYVAALEEQRIEDEIRVLEKKRFKAREKAEKARIKAQGTTERASEGSIPGVYKVQRALAEITGAHMYISGGVLSVNDDASVWVPADDLKHTGVYIEYDYEPMIEGTDEDIRKDVEHFWKKIVPAEDEGIKGAKVRHDINLHKSKAYLTGYVDYTIATRITKADAERIAKKIAAKLG